MLIDSNILVYSINTSSPKRKRSQDFLKKNLGNLDVAHQNIVETIRVLTHPRFPKPMNIKDAIVAIENILKASSIISPDYRTIHIAIALVKRYKLSSNHVFDAYLVATALSNDIDVVVTDNAKDFGKFAEIKTINPFV